MQTSLETAAERFWTAAGEPEPFPRRLEDSIALALPVMVARLPRLGLFSAERWLGRHGPSIPLRMGGVRRPKGNGSRRYWPEWRSAPTFTSWNAAPAAQNRR